MTSYIVYEQPTSSSTSTMLGGVNPSSHSRMMRRSVSSPRKLSSRKIGRNKIRHVPSSSLSSSHKTANTITTTTATTTTTTTTTTTNTSSCMANFTSLPIQSLNNNHNSNNYSTPSCASSTFSTITTTSSSSSTSTSCMIKATTVMNERAAATTLDQALHFVHHQYCTQLYSPKSILHLVDQSPFLEQIVLQYDDYHSIEMEHQEQYSSDKVIIGELYSIEKEIGNGTFGRVFLATHQKTLQKVAIKELNLRMAYNAGELSYVEEECRLLKQIATDLHENIVQLFDIILEIQAVGNQNPMLYMVFEYCENGSLETNYEELIGGSNSLTEQEAHSYFIQMIDALEHLHHRHHIAHRDLQLQNICVTSDHKIKICDFGLSTRFTPGQYTSNQYMGSVLYLSPEVHKRQMYVGPELDVWSIGVCLYKILTGFMPFRGAERIIEGSLSVPLEEEECISEECRDLLANIFQVDPEKRFTISQIKNHPWVKSSQGATCSHR